MSGSVPYTHRFVADSETGPKMARAFVGRAHRMKRQWIAYVLFLVLFTLLFLTGMDVRYSLQTRLVWAVMFALVPTLLLAVVISLLAYVRLIRGARIRVFPGAVLESGFGEDAMVLRNPVSEVRINYAAIKSVTPGGEFVFMRQLGLPLTSIYPRELFPDAAIARITGRARP
jgi:heme/copper-type cytochrome/quinol oxidase subunit 4